MNPHDFPARIAQLRAEISRHDELYYRRAAPEIGDFEYDRLKRELADLEARVPEAVTTETVSPTQTVGDDRLAEFAKHRHLEPMLSLDNTYSEEELRAFHRRLVRLFDRESLAYVVEPKIDGLAVSLTYQNGKFIGGATRGNGVEGDDVTANLRTLRSLPMELKPTTGAPLPERIEIRGEVYLTLAEFRRINREREEAGEPVFANPRNLAAGTLKLLDPRLVAQRRLEIVLYGLGAAQPAPPVALQSEFHALVRAWGLPGVERLWRTTGIDETWAAVQELDRLRDAFSYATDGAVVKLDAFTLQRDAARTAKAPRWAIAYKFAPEQAETVLRGVTLQVGRTGVLTPVAELDPVQLAGTTVSRATLHNQDEIARKDVRLGDTVRVEKAGEIIPAVLGVNLARRPAGSVPYQFPQHCPACGAAIVRLEGEVAARCPNAGCPAQVRRRLRHFASKACLDIDGLGEAVVDELVSRGWVKTLPDLYRLRREELLTLGKKVEKSTDNLLAAIEASKRAELWRVLHGLGIPHVGAAVAKSLALSFGSLEALATATPEAIDALDGVGEVMAREIAAWFAEPRNREVLGELAAAGLAPVAPESRPHALAAGVQPFAKKTFVLTGTLPTLTREQATARIEAAGGKVSGSVSKKTAYLLAGADAGSKLEKARELGVPIIDEAAFLQLVVASPSPPPAESVPPQLPLPLK